MSREEIVSRRCSLTQQSSVTVSCFTCEAKRRVLAAEMMNLSALVHNLRCSLLRIESRLLQGLEAETQLAPAPAVNVPGMLPQLNPEHQQEHRQEPEEPPGILDSIFWMAAPKKRRTIEVNRTRRRAESKLIKVKNNIEPCPECGHLKQKHILCGFCYAKVCKETALIRKQIDEMEGGPLRAPAVETVVLYEGETTKEEGKRIVERARKRPAWFSY